MNAAERAAHVQKQLDVRGRLQKRIRELSAARESFVAAERARTGKGPASLDSAMLAAAQSQATAAGFRFE